MHPTVLFYEIYNFFYHYVNQAINTDTTCSPSLRDNFCSLFLLSAQWCNNLNSHCAKKPVTTMLTYPWKCTVLHCNHLGNTWKPLVLMTRHFDYCPSASEGDDQSVWSSAPVVSRCFPGGYNVKLYISRGRLAWWLLAFLHSVYFLHKQILRGQVYKTSRSIALFHGQRDSSISTSSTEGTY